MKKYTLTFISELKISANLQAYLEGVYDDTDYEFVTKEQVEIEYSAILPDMIKDSQDDPEHVADLEKIKTEMEKLWIMLSDNKIDLIYLAEDPKNSE